MPDTSRSKPIWRVINDSKKKVLSIMLMLQDNFHKT